MSAKVYHGTIAANAEKIIADGVISPRGTQPSNWEGGPFGGNPSNPDWVYCALTPERARSCAVEAAERRRRLFRTNDQPGPVFVCEPCWERVRLDEDTIHDILFQQADRTTFRQRLLREAARICRCTVAEVKRALFVDGIGAETDAPDVALSELMIDIARRIPSDEARAVIVARGVTVAAFEIPLRVLGTVAANSCST